MSSGSLLSIDRLEVSYGAVKKGGRNLLQSARISFVLEVSLA